MLRVVSRLLFSLEMVSALKLLTLSAKSSRCESGETVQKPHFPTPLHFAVQAAGVPIEWEHHTISSHAVTPGGDLISKEALDSVLRNKVGLKGAYFQSQQLRGQRVHLPCAQAPLQHPLALATAV